jgi:hypothetical protein
LDELRPSCRNLAGVIVEETDGFESIHGGAEAPVAQRAPVHALNALQSILVNVGQRITVVQLLQLIRRIDVNWKNMCHESSHHASVCQVALTWNDLPEQHLAGNIDDVAVDQDAGGMREVSRGAGCMRRGAWRCARVTSECANNAHGVVSNYIATYIGGSPEDTDGAPAEFVADGVVGSLRSRQTTAQRYEASDFAAPALQPLDKTQGSHVVNTCDRMRGAL